MRKIIISSMFAAVFLAGCAEKNTAQSGIISFIVGTGTINHGTKKIPAVKDAVLKAGDTLEMNAGGTAVVSFDNLVDAEVQPGAVFSVNKLGDVKEFNLSKGNLWLRINRKLSKNEEVSLIRRTTTAAVRGTKFYSYEVGDLQCTCECEGKIDMGSTSGTSIVQEYDTITVSRGGKTALLSPDDLRTVFGSTTNHNHSSIDNSPMGRKSSDISADKMKKFTQLADKKLKEVR